MTNYKDYITIDPNIRFGKSIIKNSKAPVYVVHSLLANGMTSNEIIEDFPIQKNQEHHSGLHSIFCRAGETCIIII